MDRYCGAYLAQSADGTNGAKSEGLIYGKIYSTFSSHRTIINEVDRPLNMKCSFSSFSLGIKPLEFRSLCVIRCRSTRGWWIQYYSSAITVWRSRFKSKQRWYNRIINENEWTPTDNEWDQFFGSTYILIIFCLLI